MSDDYCGKCFTYDSCNYRSLSNADVCKSCKVAEVRQQVVKKAINFVKYRTESTEGALRDRVNALVKLMEERSKAND